MKFLSKAIQKRLLEATARAKACEQFGMDDAEDSRAIVVKFFTPDAQCSWFILDGEPEADGDWRLFGLCDLGHGFPELGTVMLSDLEQIRGQLGLPVERDNYYTGTLADARQSAGGFRPDVDGDEDEPTDYHYAGLDMADKMRQP